MGDSSSVADLPQRELAEPAVAAAAHTGRTLRVL